MRWGVLNPKPSPRNRTAIEVCAYRRLDEATRPRYSICLDSLKQRLIEETGGTPPLPPLVSRSRAWTSGVDAATKCLVDETEGARPFLT